MKYFNFFSVAVLLLLSAQLSNAEPETSISDTLLEGTPTANPPQNIVDSPFEVLWKFDTGG